MAPFVGKVHIAYIPKDGKILGVVGIRDVMRSLVERIWQSHDDDARATARDLLRRG